MSRGLEFGRASQAVLGRRRGAHVNANDHMGGEWGDGAAGDMGGIVAQNQLERTCWSESRPRICSGT